MQQTSGDYFNFRYVQIGGVSSAAEVVGEPDVTTCRAALPAQCDGSREAPWGVVRLSVDFQRESVTAFAILSSEPTQNMSTRQRIGQGVAIFNQGRPGSQVNQVVNAVSGPRGLNMSGPNNHRNDLGFRAGNAIANAGRGAVNAVRGAVGGRR